MWTVYLLLRHLTNFLDMLSYYVTLAGNNIGDIFLPALRYILISL